MRPKDKCPSCYQPVAPQDFQCANCELILQPGVTAPAPASAGNISVVRRMLEVPQRGIPAERPDTKPVKAVAHQHDDEDDDDAPTRVLQLRRELSGVPVVVASLSEAQKLSELEAWVVSLIDGMSATAALALRAGLRDIELAVVLMGLHERHLIEFADEPLSDSDLELPEILDALEHEAAGGGARAELPPPVMASARAAPMVRANPPMPAPPMLRPVLTPACRTGG
jgi:hypothetical protein